MQETRTETKSSRPNQGKFSAIVSAVLWTLGFGLCFVLPPSSNLSWIADFFLLLGFFPLLWFYPAGWTWLIFGICNFGIGCVLEIGYHLPDDCLPPAVRTARLMMMSTHPSMVWMALGLVCTLFGAFRMIKNTILFFAKRKAGKPPLSDEHLKGVS